LGQKKRGGLLPITIIENGDIFVEPSEMILCPINLTGSMAKGLALEFRKKFPGIFMPYYLKCRSKEGFKLGEVLTLSNAGDENPKWIICYPTKIHWYHPSGLWIIRKGVPALFDEIVFTGIHSLSIPALGCGLGEVKWKEVKEYLLSLPFPEFIDVKIFAPLSS
jgi:O-acetyl-ADP-ribose deacetylase (regulator of RNase III)